MAKVWDSVPGRLDALPDVLFVRGSGDGVSLLAVDDSPTLAGARAPDPHAAGRGQAPAVQPRSR